ncbi:MAG: hypothetical protein KIC46_09125, partial [Clostridiales bacterium]|nr:hypothetical protein [Clostridiales bacterium]
ANLPKLDDSHRLKHMGRFVFALRAKIPSRATQIIDAGAASASRQRPAVHSIGEQGLEGNAEMCISSPLLPSCNRLVTGLFLSLSVEYAMMVSKHTDGPCKKGKEVSG